MLQGCRGGGRVGGGKREGKEDGEGTRGGRGATEHRRTRTDVIQFTNQSRASVQQGKFIFNSNEPACGFLPRLQSQRIKKKCCI